jgi:Zn-dependent protease
MNLSQILVQYVCLLFSLCVHEASHAWVAERCGDVSPRFLGRVTLNPIAHIDPIGTVVMPLMMMIFQIPFLFGWAKPVPFNPRNLSNIRRDTVLIALAGPCSNLLVALVTAVVLRAAVTIAGLPVLAASPVFVIAVTLVMINVLLCLFNLIPVPPLDGYYVLEYFLPPAGQRVLEQIGPFGIVIAIFISSQFMSGPMLFLFRVVMSFALGQHV